MMPWRKGELSKGNGDEEEVDENREEDGKSPQGLTSLEELSRQKEVGEYVHSWQNGTKDHDLAEKEYICWFHFSFALTQNLFF